MGDQAVTRRESGNAELVFQAVGLAQQAILLTGEELAVVVEVRRVEGGKGLFQQLIAGHRKMHVLRHGRLGLGGGGEEEEQGGGFWVHGVITSYCVFLLLLGFYILQFDSVHFLCADSEGLLLVLEIH